MTLHARCPCCDREGTLLAVHGDRPQVVACENSHCRVYVFKRYWEVGT